MWDSETFCKKLPKIELHAHLNGSLSPETLKKLHKLKPGSTEENFIAPDVGNMKGLAECFKLFGLAHSLTCSPDAVRLATREVIREFAEDGVVYLELRSTPRDLGRAMSKEEYVKAMATEAALAGAEYGVVVKILVSIDRTQGVLAGEYARALAMAASHRFDGVIAGLDFSGDPHKGQAQTFLHTLTAARRDGLHVTAHCAEIDNEEETVALLESGVAERLGHCTFAAPRTNSSSAASASVDDVEVEASTAPADNTTVAAIAPVPATTSDAGNDTEVDGGPLWDMLRRAAIPVECCLSSNVRCGTVPSYKQHHFGVLRARGHPIVLCTDDKGVFDSTLSNEFRLAGEHFSLSREELWQLSYDSVEYCFASAEEKETLRQTMLDWKKNNIDQFVS